MARGCFAQFNGLIRGTGNPFHLAEGGMLSELDWEIDCSRLCQLDRGTYLVFTYPDGTYNTNELVLNMFFLLQ